MPTNALNGKDYALYVGNGASPEVFTKVAAVKTLKVDMKRTTVDITNKDSVGFQEMLGTASIASVSVSADAFFSNAATQSTMRSLWLSGAASHFKLIDGAGNYLLGSFIVTGLSRNNGFNDADAVSYTLESTGVVTYTGT